MDVKDRIEMAKTMGKKISYAQIFPDGEVKVETLWQLFARFHFCNREVSTIAYQEVKKAFFIGFCECFRIMTDFAGDLPEERACQVFSAMGAELNAVIDQYVTRDLGGSV